MTTSKAERARRERRGDMGEVGSWREHCPHRQSIQHTSSLPLTTSHELCVTSIQYSQWHDLIISAAPATARTPTALRTVPS